MALRYQHNAKMLDTPHTCRSRIDGFEQGLPLKVVYKESLPGQVQLLTLPLAVALAPQCL